MGGNYSDGFIRAGSAMSDNRLELKRRQTESRHKDSEATFIWRTFYGGSPEIILIIFAIADQFLAPCSRGCCWYFAWLFGLIASSRRGRHRKVRSRSRTEQRLRRHLSFNFGSLTWFHYGVYPDKTHSETKSKFSKHPNFKLKCRLNRCSVRLRDRTFLWQPRWDEAIRPNNQAQYQQQPREQGAKKWSCIAKIIKIILGEPP